MIMFMSLDAKYRSVSALKCLHLQGKSKEYKSKDVKAELIELKDNYWGLIHLPQFKSYDSSLESLQSDWASQTQSIGIHSPLDTQ